MTTYTGNVFVNGTDVMDLIKNEVKSQSDPSLTNGTFGSTAITGQSFVIPIITVSNTKISKIEQKTITLNKNQCSYCTYCSYDNQCNTD